MVTHKWTDIEFVKASVNLSVKCVNAVFNIVDIEQTFDAAVSCPFFYSMPYT